MSQTNTEQCQDASRGEQTSQAMEALVALTRAIVMAIAQTAYLLILHLWKINQELHVPSYNHQRRTLVNSAQEDS